VAIAHPVGELMGQRKPLPADIGSVVPYADDASIVHHH
jgi:hypothetical protein